MMLRRTRRNGREPGIPVVLCVDIEPDGRTFTLDREPDVRGFDCFREQLDDLRAALSPPAAGTARFNWFVRMDPQIEAGYGSASRLGEIFRDTLLGYERQGDELGLHVHDWRWQESEQEWLVDHADHSWSTHCARVSHEAFRSVFGRPCRIHRGGDRFINKPMLAELCRGGLQIDLTVEPGLEPAGALGTGERSRGLTLDYRNAPRWPYQPHPDDLVTASVDPAAEAPWFMPLTSWVNDDGERSPLYPWVDPVTFEDNLDAALAEDPPVLVMAVRSDVTLRSWNKFVANMRIVSKLGGTFVGVSEGLRLARGRMLDRPMAMVPPPSRRRARVFKLWKRSKLALRRRVRALTTPAGH
jgi:hypothetical protein